MESKDRTFRGHSEGQGGQDGSGGGGGGGQQEFDPEPLYDEFPPSAELGYGTELGYNRLVQINDRSLFTEAAQADEVINAFLKAWEDEQVAFSFLQVKSSSRESEWFIHKPHLVLAGDTERTGVEGSAPGFVEGQPIGTFVINHQRTLALRPVRAMVVTDGTQAGETIHKGDGS